MQFSMLNLENFVSRLEILYYQNWSQVFENMVFLVPLSILTITWRGKGSGGPGHDIQTHPSILYRIEGEKRNLFFTRILLSVHLITRAQLIDDAFNLARSADLNVTIALELSIYLINETDYVPYSAFSTNIQYPLRMLKVHRLLQT